ncbi:hypothetical protein GUITHDRAFT_138593 [Guillardia theta CCMP2712]|uniref:Phytanoyl-CoA dioxygenase n=1 Tax=Guillardia theta (strain CCMP2712) TaxID=905079 RepID=L1JC77_GUITC|nr:hypothetical protein GUITHDRAFT_138593 [Guillardia theta CCMP2712]EKX46126.1 hypothetical protein GUITHDRAFT_138593 [Guillardia theta CCMP2712]|eukprot:XP_005833106.1 hypothetical protein GUITHDRAFT_138593 [Guillardia theta CCMP2712]
MTKRRQQGQDASRQSKQRRSSASGLASPSLSHGAASPGVELLSKRFQPREKHSIFFQRNGFVTFPEFLSPAGLRYLRRRVDEIYRDKAGPLPPITRVLIVSAAPAVVDMLQSYLGADVQLYASQLHRKVSAGAHGHGGHAVPIHQDGDENVLTLWIALDDVDETNGGLRVLRGGHKYGRLPFQPVKTHAELSDAEYFSRYVGQDLNARPALTSGFRMSSGPTSPNSCPRMRLLSQRERRRGIGNASLRVFMCCRNEGMYCYRLKAGGAAMHHPLLPHCSESNMSMDRDRRVIILRFMSGVIQEKEQVQEYES